jgi:hypothetical protein
MDCGAKSAAAGLQRPLKDREVNLARSGLGMRSLVPVAPQLSTIKTDVFIKLQK